MREVLALCAKDLRLLIRDKVGFFFSFFFPLIYSIFFGLISSGMSGAAGGIRVAVIDEDRTKESQSFSRTLLDSPELELVTDAKDRAAATDLVRRGKCVAFVIIPQGFGESRRRTFWGPSAKLVTGIDPSRKAESGMLQGVLTKYLFADMQEMFSNPVVMKGKIKQSLDDIQKSEDLDPLFRVALTGFLGSVRQFVDAIPEPEKGAEERVNAANGWQPVAIETVDVTRQREGPRSAYEISFPQGVIWGILGCAAGFGISMVVERTKGTLVRLRMSPIGRSKVLAGKALACLTTTLSVAAVLLLIGRFFFGVRPDSIPLLLMAVICISLAFVGIMMFLSVLGKTEQAAGGIGWAILTVMAMLGGGMIPLFFMPPFMQTLSNVSPVKWSILAMEGAIWRGFTVTEMLLPCGVLLAIGGVAFTIGARAFRWTETG